MCVCAGQVLAHNERTKCPKRVVKFAIINITNGPHEENGFINKLNKIFMKTQYLFVRFSGKKTPLSQ